MKPSHTQTPRTLADCTFAQGYAEVRPMGYRVTRVEIFADYALAFVLGVFFAAFLFFGLSA